MKQAVMTIFAAGAVLFQTVNAGADFAELEKNYAAIKSISVRIQTTITNKNGTVNHKSRIMMQGRDRKRFDQVAPDRAVYIIHGGRYISYDFQTKEEIRKKTSELSDVHLLFLDELFYSMIFDPVSTLMKRYSFPEFRKGYKNITSPLVGISLRDANARVKLSFEGSQISSIEYYYKNNLNKRTVYSGYTTTDGVRLPSKTVISIFDEARTTIETKLGDISINKDIDGAYFEKINP